MVGPPNGLSISSVPSTVASRRCTPSSPLPPPITAPPRPLSATEKTISSPRGRSRTLIAVAALCLTAFVSSSAIAK